MHLFFRALTAAVVAVVLAAAPAFAVGRRAAVPDTGALARLQSLRTLQSADGPRLDPAAAQARWESLQRAIALSYPALTKAQRRLVDGWAARPDQPVAADGDFVYDAGDRLCAYDTPGGHFTVHWDATLASPDVPKPYPDASDAPTLDGTCKAASGWVKAVGAVADQVWSIEVDGFHFPAPPSDLHDGTLGGDGGSGRYDIYLLNFADHGSPGLLGVNVQASGTRGVSYLAVANTYDDLPPSITTAPLDELRVTLAHEFFHAIQTGIVRTRVYRFPQWITEGTAVWVESQVYPGIPDNFQYLPELVGARTELPLWVQDGCDTGCWAAGLPHDSLHVYGTWLFWLETTRRAHDRLLIAQLWRRMARHPEQAFRDQGLNDLGKVVKGALPERFRDYANSLLGLAQINGHPTRVFSKLRLRKLLRVRTFGPVVTATPPPILDAQARYRPLTWNPKAKRVRVTITVSTPGAVRTLRRGVVLRIGSRAIRRPSISGSRLVYNVLTRRESKGVLVITNALVLSSVNYTESLSVSR